ncbi:unnamed protein product, partial [Lampetra planeri]
RGAGHPPCATVPGRSLAREPRGPPETPSGAAEQPPPEVTAAFGYGEALVHLLPRWGGGGEEEAGPPAGER